MTFTPKAAAVALTIALAACTGGNTSQRTIEPLDPLVPASHDTQDVESLDPLVPVSHDTQDEQVEEPIRIAFVGDTGTGESGQHQVASLIDDVESDRELDALVILGDMIYEDGDPDLIGERVIVPYAAVLDGPTQLVPVLGNHDVGRGEGDLIMKTLGAPARWYSVDLGAVTLVVLDSTRPNDLEQQDFLRTTLAEITNRWTVVALHHPPFSAGFHGSDAEIRAAFVPLFEEYGVDLVSAGHDHDYQRTTPIGGVTYVVSGGGARTRPAGTADFSVVSEAVLNFVLVSATAHTLTATVYTDDGIVDRFELP